MQKFNTDDHDLSLLQLKVLLHDPQLPCYVRLRANLTLAGEAGDSHRSEGYRVEAETAYERIRAIWPEGSLENLEQQEQLKPFRTDLDTLAREQTHIDSQTEVLAALSTPNAVSPHNAGWSQSISLLFKGPKPAASTELQCTLDQAMTSTDVASSARGATEIAIPSQAFLMTTSTPRLTAGQQWVAQGKPPCATCHGLHSPPCTLTQAKKCGTAEALKKANPEQYKVLEQRHRRTVDRSDRRRRAEQRKLLDQQYKAEVCSSRTPQLETGQQQQIQTTTQQRAAMAEVMAWATENVKTQRDLDFVATVADRLGLGPGTIPTPTLEYEKGNQPDGW